MSLDRNQFDRSDDEAVFAAFARGVLRRAVNWRTQQAPPTMLRRRFEFRGTAEWYEPVEVVADYGSWLQAHGTEIAALPETQACIRKLWEHGILQYLLPRDQRQIPTDELSDEQVSALTGSILFTLTDLLQTTNSFEPTQEQILATYARYREAWTKTNSRYVAIIPLLNFSTEVAEPLPLTPRYTISRFTDEEKAWVWEVMDGYHETGLIPFHTFIQTEFKLATDWLLPDLNRVADLERAQQEFVTTDLDILNDLRNVITALRLIKRGDVAVTSYAEQSDKVLPSGSYPSVRMLSWLWSDFQVRRHGTRYTLDATDIKQVQSFVEALAALDRSPNRAGLDVALRRFNQSYSREYYEDRLIDLTIALESTLLADVSDPKTDLKYRFVLHGAALLAAYRRPQNVHDFLRAMYDARSAVVHRGKSLSDMKKKALLGYDWRDFAQACEDMTRDILAAYVWELQRHPSGTVQSITRELEARVVERLGSATKKQIPPESNVRQAEP